MPGSDWITLRRQPWQPYVFIPQLPACVDRSESMPVNQTALKKQSPEFLLVKNVWKSYWFINFIPGFTGSEIPNNQPPLKDVTISCFNIGIKTYQLSPGWVELSCLPEFLVDFWGFRSKNYIPKVEDIVFAEDLMFFFVLPSKFGYFISISDLPRALKISSSHVQPAPKRKRSHIPPNDKRKLIDSNMPNGRGCVP